VTGAPVATGALPRSFDGAAADFLAACAVTGDAAALVTTTSDSCIGIDSVNVTVSPGATS
jgi:hypothetical protein